jgi:hypothetical protein
MKFSKKLCEVLWEMAEQCLAALPEEEVEKLFYEIVKKNNFEPGEFFKSTGSKQGIKKVSIIFPRNL